MFDSICVTKLLYSPGINLVISDLPESNRKTYLVLLSQSLLMILFHPGHISVKYIVYLLIISNKGTLNFDGSPKMYNSAIADLFAVVSKLY